MSTRRLKNAPHASARERRADIGMTWLDPLRLGPRASRIRHGWAAQSRPDVRFCDVPTATIRVRAAGSRAGERPTIVFVCDPPSVVEHFDRLISRVAQHARVVCFEPPGFGFSVPNRRFTFSFDDYRAAIEAMLASLNEGPYLLAFSCVWAHIALQIAAARPELVDRLLLWQSPAWDEQVAWARRVDARSLLSTPFVGQCACAFGARKIGIGWFRQAMAKDRYREFAPMLDTSFDHGAFCCLGSLWQRFYDDAPRAVQVRQPTLLTWGAADRTHRHSCKWSIAQHVPHAVRHPGFEHAGHSPELEESDAFATLVLDWLTAEQEG
ncbi:MULTISPECIES: alpha/beta fold hydrolase [Burkholderia]|uniref:Alpha/beta hydrolase n=1 Tax=Burkholderia savannae TaxID=1637837 RepID=A0ABR5T2P3_9BURK|nr:MULTISPECIES: alpha/beta hydrolase [Burkholderia]KVK73688.1 alpha/beta hydrolase [Burkholderia sp. MSMB1498]KWZ37419.1 alpha/beta hydrolase [Burkholderia savannae]KWZ48551.1 alpha/beta hydrolase [Burkholderia savannae]